MNMLRQKIRFLRWHLRHTIPMIVRHPSTYPECPRKSALRRFLENLYIYLRDGSPCAAYDGMGLDLKGRSLDDFISNYSFFKCLDKEFWGTGKISPFPFQYLNQNSMTQVPLLQSKFLFWSYLDRHQIPVVPVLGHTIKGEFYSMTKQSPLETLDSFFVKPDDANCGKMAFRVTRQDGTWFAEGQKLTQEQLLRSDVNFVFQPLIVNHPDIRILNPSTLNTLRIVTCITKKGNYELWAPGVLRVGRADRSVDNFHQGGVAVGIDEIGRLKQYGYSQDHELRYAKIARHPDTEHEFLGHVVPMYQEAVELCLKTHRLFPTLKAIGWDVAITPSGPMLLEANHDWDLEFIEIVHHQGCRARFLEIYG